MRDKIMMAVSDDLERRMHNWARSNAGSAWGHLRAMDYGAVTGGGYRDVTIPTSLGEAADTEVALSRVQLRYQPAVRQYWSRFGLSLAAHARLLCRVGVDDKTFATWVIRGHEQLSIELCKLTDQWRHHAGANAKSHADIYGH